MLRNVCVGAVCGGLVLVWTNAAQSIELVNLLGNPLNEVVINDARFTNFRDFSSNGFDGGSPVAAAQIDVSTLEFGDDIGLRFSSHDFHVAEGQTQRTSLTFDVQSLSPDWRASGGTLQLGPVVADNGRAQVTTNTWGADANGGEKLLAAAAAVGDVNAPRVADVNVFNPWQDAFTFEFSLTLVSQPQGRATIDFFDQSFRGTANVPGVAAPEPATTALAMTGVMGLLMYAAGRRGRGSRRARSGNERG